MYVYKKESAFFVYVCDIKVIELLWNTMIPRVLPESQIISPVGVPIPSLAPCLR